MSRQVHMQQVSGSNQPGVPRGSLALRTARTVTASQWRRITPTIMAAAGSRRKSEHSQSTLRNRQAAIPMDSRKLLSGIASAQTAATVTTRAAAASHWWRSAHAGSQHHQNYRSEWIR
jgi:hypothetical protein